MGFLRGKFVLGTLSAGLLLAPLGSAWALQEKPTKIVVQEKLPTKVVDSEKRTSPPVKEEAAKLAVPVVSDGRTVRVEVAHAAAADTVAKVQAAFNRRVPRDLRTYTVADIVHAAEEAAVEATARPGVAMSRVRVKVTITCCPVMIVISF